MTFSQGVGISLADWYQEMYELIPTLWPIKKCTLPKTLEAFSLTISGVMVLYR